MGGIIGLGIFFLSLIIIFMIVAVGIVGFIVATVITIIFGINANKRKAEGKQLGWKISIPIILYVISIPILIFMGYSFYKVFNVVEDEDNYYYTRNVVYDTIDGDMTI
ncbi:MAG: hypothetical protein U0O04_04500 [Clostridia bacterium]